MRGKWSAPERGIWSIVCGMPEHKARVQRLCVLQAYFDDSGKKDQSSVQVLAGYLASAEGWANFSNRWQEILDEYGISAFRMSQAWRMARNYQHLSSIRRDIMIIKLIECIQDHAERAFVVSLPFDAHDHWMATNQFPQEQALRPYSTAYWISMISVYRYGYNMRFDQTIEVIFEEQGGESLAKILSGVDLFRESASSYFPKLHIPCPQFKSDKSTLPLQAADMLAWLVRRDAYNLNREDRSQLPETLLLQEALFALPKSISILDEDFLEGLSDLTADHLLRAAKYHDE